MPGKQLIGQIFSHYRITRKIGAGGMGEVFLARDTTLDRQVALKILPASLTSEKETLRRFIREAKAASAVAHPNVAHIYEIGESEGTHFISMEYVEGVTLAERIHQDSPLDLSQATQIAIALADALDEAHSKGIIHRDIKSKNIMLTAREQVKLLDFGLAKITKPLAESIGSEMTTFTRTESGAVMGTVPYMSPEQLLGQPVDHRTDIFSLGIVLYEMLTTKLPFSGVTATEVQDHILHADPVPLSRLNDKVTPELEGIIRKCLQKEPDRRYQSARELLVDLKNLKSESESALSMEIREKVSPRHGHYLIWAIVAIAVAVAGLIIYSKFQQGKKEPVDSIAILPFDNISGNPEMDYISDGITENLINSLSKLSNLTVMSRNSVYRYKGQNIDAQKAGRELNVKAVLTGRVLERGNTLSISTELVDVRDNTHIWGDQYSQRLSDILEIQDAISTEIADKLRLKLTAEQQERLTKRYTQNTEAFKLYLRGRYHWNKFSEDGFKKAIEYYEQAIEKDPTYALAYAGLSVCYSAGGVNYWDPKEAFNKARTAAKRAIEIDEILPEAHAALAAVKLFYDWDWPVCERELKRAIELNTNYPEAHELYAYYFEAMGQPDRALTEMKRAQDLDPLSIVINTDLGYAFFMAGSFDEAILQFRKTLELEPNYSLARAQLGTVYSQKGLHQEAINELMKAKQLEINSEVLGRLGYAYALSGRKKDALNILEQLQQLNQRSPSQKFGMALVYLGLGEKDQVFEWLEKGYRERAGWIIWCRVDPPFALVRSDPRFKDLLRRMNLPE